MKPRPADKPSPIPDTLLALAPLRLRNHREVRYLGDDQCVELTDLEARDQFLLRHFYDLLTELMLSITRKTDNPQRWRDVAAWVERHSLDQIITEVREMGIASLRRSASEQLSKSMHDVRGGALSALLGRLQLINHLAQDEDNLQSLFVLTRDHNKIMRNAIVGLDDARRQEDRLPKSHDIHLILEKWHGSVVGPNWSERQIRLFIGCRHEGALTECCLESAALDRIFYNLANNAARHCAGERVDMDIFPVPPDAGTALRFVLSNPVRDEDLDYLRREALASSRSVDDDGPGLNLEHLFNPAVSSTGSGYGLTVAADFVAGAFGLRDRRQALHEGYVGATLQDNTFRVWFHWPIADSTLPPKLDDLHQPEKSLEGG